jgi:hypothetical protein
MADKYRPAGWMCNGEVQQDQIPAWEKWALVESRRRYFDFMTLHRFFVALELTYICLEQTVQRLLLRL